MLHPAPQTLRSIASALLFMALLCPAALAGDVPLKGHDPGWSRIWDNKSWAFQLDGKQGGILTVLLGPKPLCLSSNCNADAVSAWVADQLAANGGHFNLCFKL